ncbi:MAG: ParB N-terminal domain-containing protein, partial [Gammaproteobacteria bacterium]
MIVKKRGLGRGLDALLSGSNSASQTEGNAEEGSAGISKENELRQLPVDLLQPGKYQPRTDMHNESLQDLANSIRAQGLL